MGRGGRKPGEPIYQRRHMIALTLAVGLPVVLLQLYKIYMDPVSFDAQMGFGILCSILADLILYYTDGSSAQDQP